MFRNRGQEVITGLDIGTNTIKVLVALKKAEQEELEVLAQVRKNCFGVRNFPKNHLIEFVTTLDKELMTHKNGHSMSSQCMKCRLLMRLQLRMN